MSWECSRTTSQREMIMSKKVKNVKIDLTGTYEESMDEIDNSSITDEFKDHLRKEYHKIYDDIGQMISMESPTNIPSWVKLTQQSKREKIEHIQREREDVK